jgi:AcrR family transcriptional regulator
MTKWVQSVSLSIDIPRALCQFAGMNDAGNITRQDGILDAAFQTFAAYGYKRTAMDDIARAAGMSRTALYLHFRSKEDIFRSLAIRYFDQALIDMETALNQPGQTMEQALYNGFVAKDGKFMEVVLSTPHGSELLDAGFAVSLDLAMAGEAKMTDLIARWLDKQGVPHDLGSARTVAGTIFAALKGMKSSATSLTDLRQGEAGLARMVARAMGRHAAI